MPTAPSALSNIEISLLKLFVYVQMSGKIQTTIIQLELRLQFTVDGIYENLKLERNLCQKLLLFL